MTGAFATLRTGIALPACNSRRPGATPDKASPLLYVACALTFRADDIEFFERIVQYFAGSLRRQRRIKAHTTQS